MTDQMRSRGRPSIALAAAGALVAAGLVGAVLLLAAGLRSGGEAPSPEPKRLAGRYVLASTVHLDGETQNVEVMALGDKVELVARFEGQRPLWSPDGNLIAFGRRVKGNATQVWVSDAWGRRERRLTSRSSAASHYCWHPAGGRVYYTTQEGGARRDYSQIWSVDLATGRCRHLSDRRAIEQRPLASPDGLLICFYRQRGADVSPPWGDIWVMAADGSERRALTQPPHFYADFDWSPDGQWLYYTSTEGTDISSVSWLREAAASGVGSGMSELGELGVAVSLHRMTPDGRSRTLVAKGAPAVWESTCAPQEGLVAYVAMDLSDAGEVYIAKSDGTETRNVSRHEGHDFAPQWSPDGKMLAWRRSGKGRECGIVALELSSQKQCLVARNTEGRFYTSLDWRPVAPQ